MHCMHMRSEGTPSLLFSAGAALAAAKQGDVVVGDVEAGAARHPRNRPLQLRILERDDGAAALADQVMVVLAGGAGALIARRSGAHLEALHEVKALELLERPVDACPPDGVIAGRELLLDLKCAEGAILLAEQLDYGTACSPRAKSGLLKSPQRVADPFLMYGAHSL
jgi:hypothetical protein